MTFMFASTEPSGFPAAILSRLQRYDVRRLTVPEIEGKLARILEADGRTADPAAIRLIARLAAGGMRDAESMLDQLLSSAPDTIDERRVRDLLGLADAEAVDGFVEALVAGDAATGIALLDGLEERGRDARILLDQAIDAIRGRLVEELATGDGRATPGLAEAARRLAAIDPDRAGVGGLRLQLELALFTSPGTFALATASAAPPLEGARPPVQRPAATTSQPAAPRAQPVPPPPAGSGRGARRVTACGHVDCEDGEGQGPAGRRTRSRGGRRCGRTGLQPGRRQSGERAGARRAARRAAARRDRAGRRRSAAVPVETAPAKASSPPAGDGLAALLAAWPDVVARLSADPPTKPLILACRPVAVDGAIVTLGFPEEQSFLKDAIERRRAKIEAGIGESLGHEVTVRCVVANIEVAPPPEPTSDGALVMAEANRIFADVMVDVAEVD